MKPAYQPREPRTVDKAARSYYARELADGLAPIRISRAEVDAATSTVRLYGDSSEGDGTGLVARVHYRATAPGEWRFTVRPITTDLDAGFRR